MSDGDDRDGLGAFSTLLERAEIDHAEIEKQGRRRRRRGVIAAIVVVALVLGAAGTYIGLALNAPVGGAHAAVQIPEPEIPAAAELILPRSTASAVRVVGGDDFAALTGSGEMVSSVGSTDPLPMASISKVVTALVVLDAVPIADGEDGPTIVFTEAHEDLYDKYYLLDATIQPIDAGDSMSLRDALELMLIVSASNYAEAVATWAFGSQGGFLTAAGTWLAENGMVGTTFVEPTGIDPRNVSTTADLLLLGGSSPRIR